jgi:hypothetical protein
MTPKSPNGPATPTSMDAPDHPPEQSGVLLVFTTIVQGAAPGGKEVMPFLRLVRTDAQRAALAALLSSLDRPKLDAVDLSNKGLQPTSGYKIEILAVEVSGSVLNVTVKRSSPAPEEPVRQGFEFPYHLVQVARRDFDKHQFVNYRLIDTSGEVLIEGTIESLN